MTAHGQRGGVSTDYVQVTHAASTTNTPTLTTSHITNQTESTTPTTQTDNPPTHTQTKKNTFNNINYTTNIDTHPDTATQQQISANSTQIHTSIVQTHLLQRNHNKLIHQHAPKISLSELSLPRETRRTHAQFRTTKSPILISYLHKVDETYHPSPLCPLCKTHPHTTDHLFNCTHLYTSNNILDLWMSPERVVRWKIRLAGLL